MQIHGCWILVINAFLITYFERCYGSIDIPTFSYNDDWDSMQTKTRFEDAIKNIGIAQWEMPTQDILIYDKIRPIILSFFESTSNWSVSVENNSAVIPPDNDIDFEFWRQKDISYGFLDNAGSTIPSQQKWFAIPFMQQNGINFLKHKSNPFKDNEDILQFANNMIGHCQFIMQQIFKFLSYKTKDIEKIIGTTESVSKYLWLNYYDGNQANIQNIKYGTTDHVDFGFLTLVIPSSDGLQFEYNGDWIDIPFVENKYILNLGEVLTLTTNGQIKSARHRVKLIEQNVRTSIVMFYDPDVNGNIYKYDEQKQEFIFLKTVKKYIQDSYEDYYGDTRGDVHDEL